MDEAQAGRDKAVQKRQRTDASTFDNARLEVALLRAQRNQLMAMRGHFTARVTALEGQVAQLQQGNAEMFILWSYERGRVERLTEELGRCRRNRGDAEGCDVEPTNASEACQGEADKLNAWAGHLKAEMAALERA